jgi:hypothetical protein
MTNSSPENAVTFTELFTQWQEHKEKGPDLDTGYTDKEYYIELTDIEKKLDEMVQGTVETN